jgi:N6-adenosine-specific RNA methylase IME4
MYSELPKIELFAGEHREGWHCWGNEIDPFAIINSGLCHLVYLTA